ncbi:hypothetical protein ACFVZD_40745 [Streptomyces sp. NPDC058287]|uniref:hypothetical protein n=1 Tax=unclassified Streptomyces TaxID=2593676 RepID=UPI0036EA1D68
MTAIDAAVLEPLAQELSGGHLPTVHELGAIGTGDLSALAELGLTLAGELPWRAGTGPAPAPYSDPLGRAAEIDFCEEHQGREGERAPTRLDELGAVGRRHRTNGRPIPKSVITKGSCVRRFA